MRDRPLVIDLFAGLGGWTHGFLAEGYDCVGFDIERHQYGNKRYPAQLVLQDVLTLHGSQFRDAAAIVASPPCTEYSYMAMPWKRAKQIAAALRGQGKFPEGYVGSRTTAELTALFDACFRIQREASGAAGHRIPLVLENVKGTQPWVGRAQANYGSFYLWGDIASVGGRIVMPDAGFGAVGIRAFRGGSAVKVAGLNWSGSDKPEYVAKAFNGTAEQRIRDEGRKNEGGSWFAIGSPGQKIVGQNPDGRKVPGMNFHDYAKTGKPGRSFQSAAVDSIRGNNDVEHRINGGDESIGDPDRIPVSIHDYTGAETSDGVLPVLGKGDTFGWSKDTPLRDCNSKSQRRKEASAAIAEIPFELASHIARCFKPSDLRNHSERPSHCAVP